MSDQKSGENQRSFERFPLDLSVRVSGESPSGEAFTDHGIMNNISGSGVCFFTDHPEWYSDGQTLVVHVCLPGTDQLDAGMESSGTVVWVFPGQGEEGSDDVGQSQIGISMDGCMMFETSNIEPDDRSV